MRLVSASEVFKHPQRQRTSATNPLKIVLFRKDTLLTGYEAEALVSAGHFIKMKENELYVLIRYIFQQLIKAEEPGC